MRNRWAYKHDEQGTCIDLRPLWDRGADANGAGEFRGDAMERGDLPVDVVEGNYPDKEALSTQAYRDMRVKEQEALKPVTRAEIDALEARLDKLDGG